MVIVRSPQSKRFTENRGTMDKRGVAQVGTEINLDVINQDYHPGPIHMKLQNTLFKQSKHERSKKRVIVLRQGALVVLQIGLPKVTFAKID